MESMLALRKQGIDVKSVVEFRKGLTEEEVLELAGQHSRILMTFDQDFGELAFRRRIPSKRIMLPRFEPTSSKDVTSLLLSLFTKEIKLENCFSIVEKDGIRTFHYPRKTT